MIKNSRHSRVLLSGLNLPGADLNSLWLARRVKYMDVFHNPETLQYFKTLDPGSKACRDDRYMDSIYLALKRLSVSVKQPMNFQSIVVEFFLIALRIIRATLFRVINLLQ